jgi:hypothetical protein
VNFYGLNVTWKYESGPTGPADKGLIRKEVCPDVGGKTCVTLSALPAVSGSSVPVTVTRTGASATTATSGLSSSGTGSPTSKSDASMRCAGSFRVLSLFFACAMIANPPGY